MIMTYIIHDYDIYNFIWDCSVIEHFKDENENSDYECSIKHFLDEDEYDAMKEYETHIEHFG